MTKRPARLKSIRLTELSLVDAPANPHARITLFKRHADDEDSKKMEKKVMSFASFEDACAHLRKAHGMSAVDALSSAARDHPSLLEKYQRAGDEMIAKAAETARPALLSKAEAAFEDRVDKIAKRDKVGRDVAMSRARTEHPEEFEAAFKQIVPQGERLNFMPGTTMPLTAAQREFHDLCASLTSQGVSPDAAMITCRQRYPDVFQRAYGRPA